MIKLRMIKYEDNLTYDKKNLRVVIYGPHSAMVRIKRLKDKLRLSGYTLTDYVEELPTPQDLDVKEDSDKKFASKKSKFYLGWSDVNLFTLFDGHSQGSVAIEIEHFLSNMSERSKCADFLFESKLQVDSLIEGTIEDNDCWVSPKFDNDNELFQLAESACWIHLTEDNCEKTRIYPDANPFE